MNFQLQQKDNMLYQLTDNSSNTAVVYYRVKVTTNASNTYSSIVAISTNTDRKSITLQPNPAKDYVNIYFDNRQNKSFVIKLSSMDGKILQVKKIASNYLQLNTSQYSNGTYLIELFEDNKLVVSNKLVINK